MTTIMAEFVKQRTLVMLPMIMMVGHGNAILGKIDPQQNIWVTWANQTEQSSFCLSLASASDPFRTCLFGVPIGDPKKLSKMLAPYSASTTLLSGSSYANVSDGVIAALQALNNSLPWDPQELDILGSVAIGNSSNNWTQTCFILNEGKQNRTQWTNITSKTPGFEANGPYCGWNITGNNSKPFGAYGMNDFEAIWRQRPAKALPPGMFLICGDRAWQGIPANSFGGPCYLGQLALFAPNLYNLWNQSMSRRSRRALKTLGSDCDDGVELWGAAERVFASLVPGIGTAHALTSINKLACWAVKQSNVTTQILSEMSQDMESLRHAVLQNRAAIDFLLLAQGHGCEDVEGMCCFNLSNHGQSIHNQLKWLRDHTRKIQQSNWFDDWLRSIFGDMGEWFFNLIKEGLRFLLLIVLVIIAARVIFSCLSKKLDQLTKKVFVSQNKNGGIVEEWLAEVGHVNVEQFGGKELQMYRTQLI